MLGTLLRAELHGLTLLSLFFKCNMYGKHATNRPLIRTLVDSLHRISSSFFFPNRVNPLRVLLSRPRRVIMNAYEMLSCATTLSSGHRRDDDAISRQTYITRCASRPFRRHQRNEHHRHTASCNG